MFKRFVILIFLLLSLLVSNGCASYLSYQYSKDQIEMERSIEAVNLGDNKVGIGVKIQPSTFEVLKKNGFRQLCAALIDAATIYYVADNIDMFNEHNNDNSSNKSSARDINELSIDGNDNIINIGNTTTTELSE